MLEILFEDNHLIAINKKPGMIVQADKSGDTSMDELVSQYLAQQYSKSGKAFVGVIHRLDRPVSGVILFARTSKALERMNLIFKERHVQKTYWAFTKQPPATGEGHLVNWLVKDRNTNVVKAYPVETVNSQRAELTYRLAGSKNGFYRIEVHPLTGRSHQIRAQLSAAGSPICGDNKYGYPRGYKEKFIALHAREIRFNHPVKNEELVITAPLPLLDFYSPWELNFSEKSS